MHVYDVEILDIRLGDDLIEELLIEAQHSVVNQTLELEAEQRRYELVQKKESIKQQIRELEIQTKIFELEQELKRQAKQHEYKMLSLENAAKEQQRGLDSQMAEQDKLKTLNDAKLGRRKQEEDLRLELERAQAEIRKGDLEAEVSAMARRAEAISPDLIAALQSFGDQAMVEKVAESMAPLAILGGESVSDIISRLLKGTVLEKAIAGKDLTKSLTRDVTKDSNKDSNKAPQNES